MYNDVENSKVNLGLCPNSPVGFCDKVNWSIIVSRYRLTTVTLDQTHVISFGFCAVRSDECGTYNIPKVNIMPVKILFRSESFSLIIKGIGINIIHTSINMSIMAPAQKMAWILTQ